MAEEGWNSGIFTALNARFLAKGLASVLPGGWNLAEVPEIDPDKLPLGRRPFGVVMPRAVRDPKFTNATKYVSIEFDFIVEADTFSTLDKTVCPFVTAILQNLDSSKITVADNVVIITMIRPGDIVFEKIEQIWTATMSFVVQANQPAAASAS